MADLSDTIKAVDYVVFGLVLVASLGIGVFYGFFHNKNKTNEEFLMAGRSMSILPVTMSLICSFVSAITLLGNPVEVYFYGVHFTLMAIAFIPMTFALAYIYVPVYFDLQLTSAYEYFEWRFSRKVRVVVSIFAMLHLMVYMPATVFGPSLALDQVAGINYRLSSALIFIVCILYSSIGGLKAVLWTDALQALVMFLSLGMVIGLGIKEVGGIDLIWERVTDANRMKWIYWDPDLRTRHTLWTAIIGGYLLWLPLFGATQAQIQRYNSVPTLRQSRQTLFINLVGMILIICLCSLIGVIIFAQFYDCDPIESKAVQSPDQLVPYFVLRILGKYSGVPGLLIAGLTCGSLSTVSSALNSITALITEDFVKHYYKGLSEEKLGFISKCISGATGSLAFALVFLVAIINETVSIVPFSYLFHGSLIVPIMAGFSLGIMYPWANDMGTFLGLLAGICFTVFIGLGSILASRENTLPIQKQNLTTMGCDFTNSTNVGQDFYYGNWKELHSDDSVLLKMFSLSYMWLPGCGMISTAFFGIIFSAIVSLLNRTKTKRSGESIQKKVNIKLLSKPMVKFWILIFGRKIIENVVDFDEFDFSGKFAASVTAGKSIPAETAGVEMQEKYKYVGESNNSDKNR